jgi:death-on-curing protein
MRAHAVDFAAGEAEAAGIILALAAGEIGEEGLTRWIKDDWPKAQM